MKNKSFEIQPQALCAVLPEIRRLIEARRRVREIDKLTHRAKCIADACWGWDIDRDTYDTCIIAAHYLQQIKNDKYELD